MEPPEKGRRYHTLPIQNTHLVFKRQSTKLELMVLVEQFFSIHFSAKCSTYRLSRGEPASAVGIGILYMFLQVEATNYYRSSLFDLPPPLLMQSPIRVYDCAYGLYKYSARL